MNDNRDGGFAFGDDPAQTTNQTTTVTIIVFTKRDGPLTKSISLAPDGTIHSDGSACRMSVGTARQEQLTIFEFASRIAGLAAEQAIGLGAFRDGLPDEVWVATKRHMATYPFLNGAPPENLITRAADDIGYRPGKPALILCDLDTKAMPAALNDRIMAKGGFWPAIVSVMPELANVYRVTRRSTSAGLSRVDTGEQLRGSDGQHIFLLVEDGADAKRFLHTLHERMWLAGFGWMMIGAAGQFLNRSLIDKMVCAAERLVFEAKPHLEHPLEQDQTSRAPVVDGDQVLDTRTLHSLGVVETAKLRELEAAERTRLAPEAASKRAIFIEKHAANIVERTGCKPEIARWMVERQCGGTLLPGIILPFDDPALANVTVGDVMANPDDYIGETLADPLEGVEYGCGKAKIMRRTDGSLWTNSFAHGRTTYELKYDAASIEAAIIAAPETEAADVLVRMLPHAEVNPTDEDRLRALACKRADVRAKALGSRIKTAREEAKGRRTEEARRQKAEQRTDQRPQLLVPDPSAERTPVMAALNDVLSKVDDPEPPMRDIEGCITQLVVRQLPNMHALTSAGTNAEEPKESKKAQLPAAEMPLLSRLNEYELTELIEQHIEFKDLKDVAVTLPHSFVMHYLSRKTDKTLPTSSAIATLPMVLPNGTMLAERGLDRDSGILFRIPDALTAALPKSRDECDDEAILKAMRFLCDEWLVDVTTDLVGKSVLLSSAASVVERTLISDRPAFFVTAPRRGGGKTTVLVMIMVAVTGVRPAAAAWSSNEEERRKALMAYLLSGVAAIIWDNIPRGARIFCPHIEAACTNAFIADRKLGASEMVSASAAAIHMFTGNNIKAHGDTSSRSLEAMLTVDRPDPENRKFRHPDPIGWTQDHRCEILAALFTILLGNPTLRTNYLPPTRFKDWMRLIGSAFEHAAKLYRDAAIKRGVENAETIPQVCFKDLFLAQDDEDEQSLDLASTLDALAYWWPKSAPFTAAELAVKLNDRSEQRIAEELARVAMVREFLYPDRHGMRADEILTALSVGKRLKHHVGEPVHHAEMTLTLRDQLDAKTQTLVYWVAVKPDDAAPPATDMPF